MNIIGIDPGKSGAICVLFIDLGILETQAFSQCPTIKVGKKTEYDFVKINNLIKNNSAKVYIEKAQAMPKQGIVSMFSYGSGYGAWIMACVANGIPYEIVAPQTWKKAMLKDMPKSKGASIIKAKQLCPSINLVPPGGKKDNHNFAEAYLIARYGLSKTKEIEEEK